MEPQVEDFPRWLGDEYVVDEAHVAELRRAVDDLGVLDEMFSSRGWEFMAERISEVEFADARALETCPIDEVQRHRDRLGWWRWLLDQPNKVHHELENAKTLLKEHG